MQSILEEQQTADQLFDELVRTETTRLVQQAGANIKGRREALTLTQAQLARAARVSQSYLSKLESGQVQNIELKSLVKLGVVLGFRIQILLEDTPND